MIHLTPAPEELATKDISSHTVAHERPSPTAEPQNRSHRVVVGVDGSEESLTAVTWAATEARRREDDLEVVHAWWLTPTFGYPNGIVPPATILEEARQVLAHGVRAASDHGVHVTPRLVKGDPTEVLINAAAEADLLVVGHRQRKHFGKSVSVGCARQTSCPIVIVPTPKAIRTTPKPNNTPNHTATAS